MSAQEADAIAEADEDQAPRGPRHLSRKVKDALIAVEKETITSALLEAGGNISRAATRLGIYRQQLQRKIKQNKISV